VASVSDRLAAAGLTGGRFCIQVFRWPLGVIAIVVMTQVANAALSFGYLDLLTFSSAKVVIPLCVFQSNPRLGYGTVFHLCRDYWLVDGSHPGRVRHGTRVPR
jgi:hypothetical protein